MAANLLQRSTTTAATWSHLLSSRLRSAGSTIRHLSEATRKRIEAEINTHPICVFMKGVPSDPRCKYSRKAMEIFSLQGVTQLRGIDVLEDQEIRDGIKEVTGFPTIPQVFIKGQFEGGVDVLTQLHNTGELSEMLAKHGLICEDTNILVRKKQNDDDNQK
ncbi:glutaredoxin [Ramicandelaber brevisporus]|nr:glutaredoxin [Ramicandelaber brevisporus]